MRMSLMPNPPARDTGSAPLMTAEDVVEVAEGLRASEDGPN